MTTGPEDPLSKGIVDQFEAAGMRIFGASQKAARIESSKSFAKMVMNKYGVPTAAGQTFTDYKKAEAVICVAGGIFIYRVYTLRIKAGQVEINKILTRRTKISELSK